MCLSCNRSVGVHKPEIKQLFKEPAFRAKVSLHTHDNKEIYLSEEQIKEIEEQALVLIATGVDFCTDIWAVQWPKYYKPKTF